MDNILGLTQNSTKAAGSAAFAFFIIVSLFLPAAAQEESANEPGAGYAQAGMGKSPVDKPEKKIAVKKKTAKKKKRTPPEPPSEYKFQAQDTPLSYTFDKKGDPIIKKKSTASKDSKKGKLAAGGAKQAPDQTLPKLKNSPAGAARYVCPMGEYEGDKPGTCPKCGMTLVEKK